MAVCPCPSSFRICLSNYHRISMEPECSLNKFHCWLWLLLLVFTFHFIIWHSGLFVVRYLSPIRNEHSNLPAHTIRTHSLPLLFPIRTYKLCTLNIVKTKWLDIFSWWWCLVGIYRLKMERMLLNRAHYFLAPFRRMYQCRLCMHDQFYNEIQNVNLWLSKQFDLIKH